MVYNWVYFRTSPRGNNKFGITNLPWSRLRMQQQGTDEEIQFDHLWLIESESRSEIEKIEDDLKKSYRDKCLKNKTNRAGHTEWFEPIDVVEFENRLKLICEGKNIRFLKVSMDSPYKATRSSDCPFGSPYVDYMLESWTRNFWEDQLKILQNSQN